MYSTEPEDDYSWYDRNPYQRYPDDPFYWPLEREDDNMPFKPIGYSSEKEHYYEDDRGHFSYEPKGVYEDLELDFCKLAIILAKKYKLSYDNREEVGFNLPLSKQAALELVNEDITIDVERCVSLWESEENLCPCCQQPMVKRVNRRTHTRFWGCSTFPRCKFSKQI